MTKKSLLKLAKKAALAEVEAAASLPATPLLASLSTSTFETQPKQGITPLRHQPPRRVQSFAARRRNK